LIRDLSLPVRRVILEAEVTVGGNNYQIWGLTPDW
jgi:hypothetical protein